MKLWSAEHNVWLLGPRRNNWINDAAEFEGAQAQSFCSYHVTIVFPPNQVRSLFTWDVNARVRWRGKRQWECQGWWRGVDLEGGERSSHRLIIIQIIKSYTNLPKTRAGSQDANASAIRVWGCKKIDPLLWLNTNMNIWWKHLFPTKKKSTTNWL